MRDEQKVTVLCAVTSHRHLSSGVLKVELEIAPRDSQTFFEYFTYHSWDGKRPAVLVPVSRDTMKKFWGGASEHEESPTEADERPKFAHHLHSYGFFRASKVQEAAGTDDEFLAWVRTRPSAISDEFSEYVDGEGRCEAAHVRRSDKAGVGMKPPYSAIPLTHEEHRIQHEKGMSALGHDKQWFVEQAVHYASEWAKTSIRLKLGRKSFKDVGLGEFMGWAQSNGLAKIVPQVVVELHERQQADIS